MRDLKGISIDLLSQTLGMSKDALILLAKHAPRDYRERKALKKNGDTRLIESPSLPLKKAQRLLLSIIFQQLPLSDAFFGRKGTSVIGAVKPHCNKDVVITLDIKSFFPSVTDYMVRGMLLDRGAEKEVANVITRLVTRNKHLPQGAPTSSCVAALVLNPAVKNICRALQIIPHADISVYVDDITLSGPSGITGMLKTITRIIERHGFQIHTEGNKIRIMPRTGDQVALGLYVNDELKPTKEFMIKYEAIRLSHGDGHPKTMGMKAFLNSVMTTR